MFDTELYFATSVVTLLAPQARRDRIQGDEERRK
jgi:hypothetical protein